jgi:uncharacterized protein YmfQ (DUF2313 family)
MSPSEIQAEINRLQKQLDSTPREFKLTVEFYVNASTPSEIATVMDHINRAIRKYGGTSVSYTFTEN